MKSISLIYLSLLMAGGLLHAKATLILDDVFLSALRAEAAHAHPATRAGSFRVDALEHEVRGVRLWEDPTVGLSLLAADQETRRSDGDITVSFEQPLPKSGLSEASRAMADALRRAELENYRSSILEVGAAAARDAVELALADESIALQTEQVKWLNEIEQDARQRAANPTSTSVDVLRLAGELARENLILAAARVNRESLVRRLNLRLGRPLESPWPILNLDNCPAPVPVARTEIGRIPHVNPKLRVIKETATAASAEVRVTNRERLPQLSVAVDTAINSDGDFRSATVGLKMSLPYINRGSYSAKVAASQLREKAALKDIESTRLEVASAVLAAVSDATNAAAQARAYSGEIYDRAQSAAKAIEGLWISSDATLADLLDAKRQLLSIRLEQRRFIAMQRVALEGLNVLVPRTTPRRR